MGRCLGVAKKMLTKLVVEPGLQGELVGTSNFTENT